VDLKSFFLKERSKYLQEILILRKYKKMPISKSHYISPLTF
jgi:hypothetical protein